MLLINTLGRYKRTNIYFYKSGRYRVVILISSYRPLVSPHPPPPAISETIRDIEKLNIKLFMIKN